MIIKKGFVIAVTICYLTFTNISQVNAEEKIIEDEKAIVFVVDASNSMNNNDQNRLAIDTMAQLIYSLPSNYQVGLVAYNNDIVASSDLVKVTDREELIQLAETIEYKGYTNAGEGLEEALSILSKASMDNKSVIILSDGEIIMNEEEATHNSLVKFNQSVEQAVKEDIAIHVIGLGEEMETNNNTIFIAAEKTEGEYYYAPFDIDLQKVSDTLLLDVFNVKKITTALIDATGEQESLTIDLPLEHISKARILVTSLEPIVSLQSNFTANSGQVHNGKHYSVIELNKPAMGKIDVKFQGEKGSKIQIDVITEYTVIPKAEVTYIDTELDERILRKGKISITFYDGTNPNLPLFTEQYFNKNNLPILINNEVVEGVIEDGVVTFEKEVTESELLNIDFDYKQLSTNIVASQPIQVTLEEPPELVLPPDYRPIILIVSLITLIIIAIIIWIVVKHRNSKKQIEPVIPLPSKYSYYGKFNIYVTRSPSGEDVSPRTYNLFRVPPSEVISLKTIIEQCQIQEIFEGAEKIFFRSGANRTLTLINNSDCTLLKNREILIKDHSYQFHIDERVDITFEDEVSELVLQYRHIKPNERSG